MCEIKEKDFNDSPKSDAKLQPFCVIDKTFFTKMQKNGLK